MLKRLLLATLVALVLPAAASAATVGGTVTAADGGAGIGQYVVELRDANKANPVRTCTTAAGAYTFTGVANGTYYVYFSGEPMGACSSSTYEPRWYSTSVANALTPDFADPVTVTGADRTGINAVLRAEGTITGTVRSADGLTGLKDVSVRAVNTDGTEARRTCSTADGSYRLGRLAPLPLVVQFVADATCGQSRALPSRFYKASDPNGSLVFSGASSVNVDNGQNLPGIDVRLSPAPQRTLTVTATGPGTVTDPAGAIACPGVCSETRADGTVVSLTATPQAGATFTGWTGACSGTGACSVTLDADKAVGATFTAPPSGGGGGGGGGAGGSPKL